MSDELTMDRRSSDFKPVPDPTTLTTEALAREVKVLKDLIDQLTKHESSLRTKDIEAIQREFELLEKQRVEQKTDSKDSLAAALAAAKEAVKEQTASSDRSIAKTENATNDQIKQINVTFNTAMSGLERTINDLKERVNKQEQALVAHAAGQTGEAGGKEQNQGLVFNVVMGLVAVGSLIIAFVAR